MQYNFYNIEILGEEKLKGVGIPVVIDNKNNLSDDEMQDIAKVFNAYRTVFIRASLSDNLEMRVFSSKKEMFDCFYAEVAAVYSLTQSSIIREIEMGNKEITVNDPENKSKVSISYEDMKAVGVCHKIDFPQVIIEDIENTQTSHEVLISTADKKLATKILYVADPLEFSKLRKNIDCSRNSLEEDKLLVHYDPEFKNVFFYVARAKKSTNKLDSRHQLGFIVKYLLAKGIKREDIDNICHLLNSGQYSIMEATIEEDKFYVRMNARTFAEGILNI
ncbi:MAG: PhzF family phenazine biosynthesis protein [Bacillota bacterium]|nr:PhzF family phenazine biosynthesis protein [Bacillota bacterium]